MSANHSQKIKAENRDLKLQVKQLQTYLDSSSDVIMLADNTGEIIYVNHSIKNMLGYPPAHYLNKKAFDFIHNEDREKIADHFSNVVSGKPAAEFVTLRLRKKNNGWRTVEGRASLAACPGKACSGKKCVIINARDVTYKEALTQKLQEARDYLDTIIKMSHDGIVVVNGDGCLEFCNDAVSRIFGWSTEDLIGEPFIKFIPEDRREQILGKWDAIAGRRCR